LRLAKNAQVGTKKSRFGHFFNFYFFSTENFASSLKQQKKKKKVSLDCKFFFTLGRRISLTLKNLSLMLYSLFSLTVASNKG